ncbi:MAG: bifunctional phosphopantothenoylcysteine decarboxylase/phosphopantothenate--cysteine ligase CoaBC [Melioribacteraceae bacterium]|nr:bifunctional phosphopantothenoylcysteine decarboxylase/phosphopantothenate--cysteine ligase CoaBC [Melioribacteraceae bacterium]
MNNFVSDSFKNKNVLLGITGGIAAYKACLIIRELVTRGADVKVVMTPAASEFITPLTLSTLSGNDVVVKSFPASQKEGVSLRTWHIETALWADIMLIAPLTINTLAKISCGMADNALTTMVSAIRSPLVLAPAADLDMYQKPSTLENINKLTDRGSFIIDAEIGFLASGLTGPGRMASVEKIIDATELVLSGYKKDLVGKRILITAGPTLEDIDPVRFIGNRSSGKMGYKLANSAFLRGADVTLISGPTNENTYPEVKVIYVRSAAEMKIAVEYELKKNDILIKAAAVADYKPSVFNEIKLKKENKLKSIELSETEDILASINKENKIVVGFALETDNEITNAKSKLDKKNLDMIVLNSLKDSGAGFESDTNKISIIKKDGNKKDFDLNTKFQIANNILTELKTIK